VPRERVAMAQALRRLLADLAEAEELVALGAHVPGAVPALDRALARKPDVLEFLRQGLGAPTSFEECGKRMAALAELGG
jgi:flagellar biosynthesis/type III secretory pathway ATPase